MTFDKPHMSEKGIKIHPARKGFCADHQPLQLPMLGDVWIDLSGQALEVGGLERRVGFKNEYSLRNSSLLFSMVFFLLSSP
jgi:hypothetical protein